MVLHFSDQATNILAESGIRRFKIEYVRGVNAPFILTALARGASGTNSPALAVL